MSIVGTTGWTILAPYRAQFPTDGSHLRRYAARLNGVEINSSFYRPHKRATYERWATAVSADFRFSVKVPRFAADPPRAPGDGEPGGDTRLAHFRLHGSPKIYYSDYPEATLETLAPTSA